MEPQKPGLKMEKAIKTIYSNAEKSNTKIESVTARIDDLKLTEHLQEFKEKILKAEKSSQNTKKVIQIWNQLRDGRGRLQFKVGMKKSAPGSWRRVLKQNGKRQSCLYYDQRSAISFFFRYYIISISWPKKIYTIKYISFFMIKLGFQIGVPNWGHNS
jgi:hypothetical protein